MAIDIKNLKDANLEDLHRESRAIATQLAAGRDILKAVNDEITIRENMDLRVKPLEGMSDSDLERALEERKARRAKAQSAWSQAGMGGPSQQSLVSTSSPSVQAAPRPTLTVG